MDAFAAFDQMLLTLSLLFRDIAGAGWVGVALKFLPFVLLFELPVQLTIMFGAFRHAFVTAPESRHLPPFTPAVTCIVTCYSEGREVTSTIRSLTGQLYDGHIEILMVVDGAERNAETADAVRVLLPWVNSQPKRRMALVPKIQRGGRVSSLNQGLALARGDVVMALDGDTSFDNDMVRNSTRHFTDPGVVAVAGNLRVRNARKSLVTRLQAVEYMLSIHMSRAGLDEFGAVNNISGAFGVFRRSFLQAIGGWDSGTAEDLDLTLRIKKYFTRHPELKIRFEPLAIGHTDAPTTLWGFLQQRLRWDGDLFYLYMRKHRAALTPELLGWVNFIALVWTGLFFQLMLPFLVVSYMAYVFIVYPPGYVLGVLVFVYLFYLLLTVAMYVEYVLLLSERRRHDLSFAWVLLVFPGFAFVTRVWNAVSTVNEALNRSHLESSMAPWWVLRRTKF